MVGVVFLIEGYFILKNWDRSVALGTHFDAQLGWVNIPNKSFTSDERTYTTNKLGFRSPPINPSKKQILILGDSVAYGAGVNDHETLSFYLNEKFPDDQVLNMAVSGYGIGQYYLTLKNFIKKTNPKLIVNVIYTGNDFSDSRKNHLFGISKPLFQLRNGELVNLNPKISRFSCQNLFSRSWLNSLFSNFKIQNKICSSQEIDPRSAQLTVKKLFREIHDIGKINNADTIFALSPTLTGTQWLNCYWQGKPENCKNLDSGFHQNYRKLKNLLEESKLPFLDLNNALLLKTKGSLSELSKLYNQDGKDFHHYSPKGNSLVAKTLANFINKDLKTLNLKNKTTVFSSEENKNKKLAFSYIQSGEFQKSLELIEDLISQHPISSELHFLLGLSFHGLIQYDKALKAFRKAIDLDPMNFNSHNLVGLTYLKLGKIAEAIVAFKSSLKIMPDFADTHFNLALALDGIKKGKQALIHMSISKDLYRRDKNDLMAGLAEKEVNSYLRKYNLQLANLNDNSLSNKLSELSQIKKFEKVLYNYPLDLDNRYQLAQKYLDTGQIELAQNELKFLLEIYPQGALFWNDLGFISMKLNQFQKAAVQLETALKINPNFARANFNLASVMEITGNKEKAIYHFKKALDFFSKFNNEKFIKLSEEAIKRLSS